MKTPTAVGRDRRTARPYDDELELSPGLGFLGALGGGGVAGRAAVGECAGLGPGEGGGAISSAGGSSGTEVEDLAALPPP